MNAHFGMRSVCGIGIFACLVGSCIGVLGSTLPAIADTPEVDIVDFLVDWSRYEGQSVKIKGARVAGANTDFVILSAPGVAITARGPWTDREDLRYLLRNCTNIITGDDCNMVVAGTVRGGSIGDGPELVGSDFDVP